MFPKSKPYITKKAKDCINDEQLQLVNVQSKSNQRLREAKQQHKGTLKST